MDAHLLRLNQMSYQQQHLMNNRTNRSHYSTRQQQHQQQQRTGKLAATAGSSLASSTSENDDQLQLSSLSSATNKTNSSQQAMLAQSNNNSKAAAMHQKQRQQAAAAAAQRTHHAHANMQQAQQQQHQQQQHHAKSKQSLAAAAAAAAAAAQNDAMTTSSGSDHTMDDLHHLAPHTGYSSHTHRLAAARAAAAAAAAADASSGCASSSARVGSQSGSRFLLGVLFTLAELLFFMTVFLWLYWSYQHDDGLSWQNDRKQQFNTHAALMLFGFIFLNGQAMLIYRSFQCCSKIYTKILHTILFVLATSAISLGLILGYTAQENVGLNNKPIMHFYSLHAWCGLTTVGLFVLQFVFGFVSFLILLCCDHATSQFRAALLPIHKTFGLIIFSLAIATCLTGLLQTARSRLR